MLRLITSDGFSSSAFTTTPVLLLGVLVLDLVLAPSLVRGLRPWKDMLDGERWPGWCLWMAAENVGAENKEEEAAIWCCFLLLDV